MTKKIVEITKIGPKGQVVLRKDLREALGIKPGEIIRQELTPEGILVKPIEKAEIIKRVNLLSKKIGRSWPKGLSAVQLMREERR